MEKEELVLLGKVHCHILTLNEDRLRGSQLLINPAADGLKPVQIPAFAPGGNNLCEKLSHGFYSHAICIKGGGL